LKKNQKDFWNKIWDKYLYSYLNTVPRTGIFLLNFFRNIEHILEVGCGSARDSVFLAKKGFEVFAVDFNKNLIFKLQQMFHYRNLRFIVADAFNLSFSDGSFDLVFHNGLLGYFDDKEIKKLVKEHARVSRRYVVFFVHNRENLHLEEQFRKKSEEDPLYKIRFFSREDLKAIINTSGIDCRSIKFRKFGGLSDALYAKCVKRVIPNPVYPVKSFIVPRLYQFQPWKRTERICCIIELDK